MSDRSERDLGFARGAGAPRSSLWAGILGAAPVVSSALALELGRDLVVNSFGDTDVVKTLATALRSLAVLLVVGAVLFAGYRWYARRRESGRAADQLAVLMDLVEPDVPLVDARPAVRAPACLTDQRLSSPSAAVLRDLPVHDYSSAALLTVLDAVREAPVLSPGGPSSSGPPPPPAPSSFESANDLLAHLVNEEILTSPEPHRYCLVKVPVVPTAESRIDEAHAARLAAAISALLHYHAGRARAWAVAIETVRYAAPATRWFTATAPVLHDLVLECVKEDFRPCLPTSALPDLVRIIDALEVWYVRTDTIVERGFAALCTDAAVIGEMKNYVLHHDLLKLRADPATTPLGGSRRYRPMRWATGFAVRWEHDAALRGLRGPTPDLTAAVDGLERAWWLLPRADVGAEVCALINLAVVELQRNRLVVARDRLDLVFARTEGGREPGGRVHAHEIAGILCWMDGDPNRALRNWRLALTGYRALADDLGTARCLRHLGSALVVAPQHWATVLGDTPKLSTEQVWRQASGWLAEADRSSPRSSAVGETYRALVRTKLAPIAPRTTIDRWPLPIEDPELTP